MTVKLSPIRTEETTQILIVEDERIIALNLKEHLESLGYSVIGIAATGEGAIKQAIESHPDLVLMDIRLQGQMDGIEAAQQIWENWEIPAIYVTGHSDTRTLERAKLTAPFGYILKPVKEQELHVSIEAALQRYERVQVLTAILKNMGDGAIVVDRDSCIQFLNQAAESLTGWSFAESRGRKLTEVFNVIDERTQQSGINFEITAIEQAQFNYIEHHILLVSRQETRTPIGYSIAPIKDKNGNLFGAVFIFRDNAKSAQLKQAKQLVEGTLEELKQTQSRLIKSEKISSIARMAAAVINEINNPAGLICGNLPLARRYFQDLRSLLNLYQQTYPNLTPEIQHHIDAIDLEFILEDWEKLLHSIQLGSERILAMISSFKLLGEFSRLEELERQTVNIHELIEDCLHLLQPQLRAEGRRPPIAIVRDYGELPLVSCYASQVSQAFIHLLKNAIEALEGQAEPRIITIRTEAVGTQGSEGQTPCDRLIIRIADNGCGMTEEVQQKLFDPFFTTKPVGVGAGLGLSISYQIVVKKHQGRLSYHSIPGQGTEFIIEIPQQVEREPYPS